MKAFCRKIYKGKRRLGIMDLASITRKEVEAVLDGTVKPALVAEHRKIVEDWESDVDFAAKKVIKPNQMAVYVFPTGKDKMVWVYVDQGTRRHPIDAVNAPRLVYMWGGKGSYTPKTLPGVVVKGGGYVRNPTLRRPKHVDHPGTDPRLFSQAIAEDYKPYFWKEVEKAFQRAAWRVNSQK